MRLIVSLLALILVSACDRQKADTSQPGPVAAGEAEATGKGVDRTHKGEAAPSVKFTGPNGKPASFADFRGNPTLVNLWATWCAPCIKELPTLDWLAASLDPSSVTYTPEGQLSVIAISQDMATQHSVEAFLKSKNINNLGAYHDSEMAISSALGAQILPTTILYDANGKEVWRYTGDLDWTGAEAAKLLSEVSPQKS